MRFTDFYFSWWLRPGKVRTLIVGGVSRSYIVHAPKGHDLKSPLPVVLALHGATMNGPMMASFSGLNRKADEAGFLAVYPSGTGKNSSFFWNGGSGPAAQNKVDDVAFIDALLDDLRRAYPVDAKRVYATGMSNGAMMAYRLAAELSGRIAAIAPVSGTVATEIGQPKRPVSVLHFHGTSDELVTLGFDDFQFALEQADLLAFLAKPECLLVQIRFDARPHRVFGTHGRAMAFHNLGRGEPHCSGDEVANQELQRERPPRV